MNGSQEVIHDKVGYLAAHALATGWVSTEMDAGENSAQRRFFISGREIGE